MLASIKVAGVALTGAQALGWVSDGVELFANTRYSFQIVYTGTPTGTVTVEGSVDGTTYDPVPLLTADSAVAQITLGEALSIYTKVRMRWTRTAGTMTITSAQVSVLP